MNRYKVHFVRDYAEDRVEIKVKYIRRSGPSEPNLPFTRSRSFFYVTAQDELGAFAMARRILAEIGYTL